MSRIVGACLLLVGACGSNGTTWIGTQIEESEPTGAKDAASDGAVRCEPAGPGDACTELPARRLPPLVVQGNQVVQNGRPYHLYAMARSTLLWGELNYDGCNGDDHFRDVDLDAISKWNVNAVRIGLSTARWFGRRCDAASYPLRIDHAIAMANAHGLYAILDLHWTDLGGSAPCDADCQRGLQPMPDAESVPFWREVATRFGTNPGVVFDVFNEPSLGDWSCWRNGGCQVTANDASGMTYTATGMQDLVDAVRGVAPASVIIVAGASVAEDLSGIMAGYAISGAQIVYGAHLYRSFGSSESEWLARFGSVSAMYPVMMTELGPLDCAGDQTERALRYLDAPLADAGVRIGWGVRSWNRPGDCGYPSIIADWAGAPLGAHGALVRQHLQSYGTAAGAVP